MKIGFIGLGKMGSRIVQKLLREGHEVVAWNRSDHKLKNVETLEELIRSLEKPRIVWVMITAGEATQKVLDELSKFIEKDDIIIDGGNSRFKDTEKRFKDFKTKGIKFLGIGVSGGIIAFENGYPLMVGGDKRGYDYIAPVLDSLSSPNGGHEYFGEGGAGHFVKMIHNGIEYGIMQSLGEGFGILEKAEYNFDLVKVAKLWQKGTLVSGFMLERVVEVLSNPSILSSIDGYIEESGEAKWTVDQAKEEGGPIDVIEKSLEFRRKSQKYKDVQNSFAAKMISGLRNAFGGHEFKKK